MVACGADHPDAPGAGGRHRATDGRQDHLDDGHVVAFPGIAQAGRRRGVAGDHERLDAAVHQVVADGQRVRADLGDGQRTVRSVGGVADVDDVLVGQLVDDRARDRQPADAGVEDADRREAIAHEVRAPAAAGLLARPGLAFRAGQPVGGQHSGDRAAQVALPGHPAAAVEHRHRAPQDAAVDEQHHQADDDLPDVAGEPAEHQQECQPAEDQSGGADVVGLAARSCR